MSSGSYKQVYVQCPFYRYDDGKGVISCQGLVDGGYIKVTFPTKEEYNIQMDTFCCNHYDYCELFRALVMMTEEGERLYKDGVYNTGGLGLRAGAAYTAKPACDAGNVGNRSQSGGRGSTQDQIPCAAILYR